MTVYSGLIRVLWLGLFAYWLVAAAGAKRNVGTWLRWRESGVRLVVIMLVLLALRRIP